MDKEFKNIDDLYRSELGGTVTEAPDFVKKNIDSALGFNKRKSGLLMFSLIALLSTAGLTALILTNLNASNQVAQSSFSTTELTEIDLNTDNLSVIEPNSGSQTKNADYNVINAVGITELTSESTYENSTNANSNLNQSAPNTQYSNRINLNSSKNSRIASEPSNSERQGVSSTQNNGPDQMLANGTSETRLNKGPQVDIDGVILNFDSSKTTGITDGSAISSEANPLSTNQYEGDNITQTDTKYSAADDSKNLATYNDISAISNPTSLESGNTRTNDPIANNTNNSLVDSDEPEKDSTTSSNNDTPALDSSTFDPYAPAPINQGEKDNYKPFMLSLTSGINTLRSNYTSDDMNEQTLYGNSLSDRVGNQTNLDFTYRLKNGLTFGTGLGLNNYDEKYEFTTYQTIIDTTEIFETIIYDSSGFSIDTVYTYAYDKLQKGTKASGRNKATYFSLPVHLGTQMRFNKFQLDLYASARFNFLMRSSGAYYNDNEIKPFGKENSIYKSFYIDVLFASKVHYNLWKNLYLTGTVQYRPVMGNSFKEVSFNKTFDYMHFGLGLSLRL